MYVNGYRERHLAEALTGGETNGIGLKRMNDYPLPCCSHVEVSDFHSPPKNPGVGIMIKFGSHLLNFLGMGVERRKIGSLRSLSMHKRIMTFDMF